MLVLAVEEDFLGQGKGQEDDGHVEEYDATELEMDVLDLGTEYASALVEDLAGEVVVVDRASALSDRKGSVAVGVG